MAEDGGRLRVIRGVRATGGFVLILDKILVRGGESPEVVGMSSKTR